MTNSINWIGIDDHAEKLTIAHYVGEQKEPAKEWEVDAGEQGRRHLIRWLRGLPGGVRCVYGAGPCGYELYRLLTSKGMDCAVAAPSLTPVNQAIESRPTGGMRESSRSCTARAC